MVKYFAAFYKQRSYCNSIVFFYPKWKTSKEILNEDDTYPLWIGLMALLIIIALFQLLKKETAKQNLPA